MKIKLLTGRVGTGFSQEPDTIIELPDVEARRMIQTLQAEPVPEAKKQQQANPQRR